MSYRPSVRYLTRDLAWAHTKTHYITKERFFTRSAAETNEDPGYNQNTRSFRRTTMKKSLLDFISDQRVPVPPVLRTDLTGKHVIVTGANTGVGFEAAKHFASMNPARLILACRNLDKGKAAATKIQEATKCTSTEVWQVDLSNFASVKEFAERYQKEGGRLDLLIANAGVALMDYQATDDGWEMTLQVNHLSTALISLLLLPSMLRTAQDHTVTPRLVVVSSDVHYWATIDPKVVEHPSILGKYNERAYCTSVVMAERYLLSKLLNVLFVRALNAHLPPNAPVIVNAVSPGFCDSELDRQYTFPLSLLHYLLKKVLAHTAEEGGRQLVIAAIGAQDEEAKLRGAYLSIVPPHISEVSDWVLSEQGKMVQGRIWDETIDILSKVSEQIKLNVDDHLL